MTGLELTGGTAIVAAIITILIGIANCFFGYRIFRILLGILGFIGGAIAGWAIVQALVTTGTISSSGSLLYYILAALIGGALGAVLLIFVYYIGIFLLGAAAGFAIGYAVPLAFNASDEVTLIAAVVLALVGGVLALLLQRVIIIIATAISGAFSIVWGVALLVSPRLETRVFPGQTLAPQSAPLIMLIAWIVLAIAGMVVQFVWTAKKKTPSAPVAAAAPPQVVVQQYNVPGQPTRPAQQAPSAPPTVVQSQPMAAPPPVVPTVVQPAPQAPPTIPAPEQPYVPPMPAPEEEVQPSPAPAAGGKFCPNCGQLVAYGTTFCTNCGNSVAHLWQ